MKGWIMFLRAEWDRALGWTLVLLGIVAVVLGFSGVADSALVADQLAYIASGGIGGLLLCGLGVGLLVSADLHDEWRKLDHIEAVLRTSDVEAPRPVVPEPVAPPARPDPVATPAAVGAGFLVLGGWHHAAGTADFGAAVGGVGRSSLGLLLGLVGVAGSLVVRRSRLAGRKRELLGGFLLADLVARRRARTGGRPEQQRR